MGLAAEEVVNVMVVDAQPRLGRGPGSQLLAADGQYLRLDEGQRAQQPAQDAHAAADALGGRLVGRVHRLRQIGVDEGLLGPLDELLPVAQGVEQGARPVGQVALMGGQAIQFAAERLQFAGPFVNRGEDAGVVPGVAGVNFVAGGNVGKSHVASLLVGYRWLGCYPK